MIGQTISNYRILDQLGHGTYVAQDAELDRKVVLKFLPEDFCSDPEKRARFVRDAKSAAGLHHPNVVTIYKVGEHSGRPFVAMEYVEGRTLADATAGESIGPRDAAGITLQVCDGLIDAHKNGILHRVLGPDNVFIDHGGRARIADLGFAACAALSGGSKDTRIFESPERARGGSGDARSDVYSVGALLRELDKENHFQAIVSCATSERPSDRYPSVEALAVDLAQARDRMFGAPRRRRLSTRNAAGLSAVVLLMVMVAIVLFWKTLNRGTSSTGSLDRRIVAVLPFENLGDAKDDYFADGMTDEITSRLALMPGLGVVSRTSSREYKHTDKSIREIGKELRSDYIIEGTVRWDNSNGTERVRIAAQLIRVSDDTHVWANTYEREITEIFSVQMDIAARIAKALDVTLLENERRALTSQPTKNIEAYKAYLQGMKEADSPDFSRESFEHGIEMFEHAIALDPDFALAYASLSSMHSRMVHYGFDRSAERKQMAKRAVDRAFSLKPDLAEAHLALGYYYYWVYRDYDRALTELEAAAERRPNNSEIVQATAYVKRRQGDLEACAELLEHDLELNPLDAAAAVSLGETYGTLRRYAEAERSFRDGIELAPDNVYPYTELALMYLRWRGDVAAARETLNQMPPVANTESCRAWFFVDLLDRDYPSALKRVSGCPDGVLEAAVFFIPIPLLEGIALRLAGDSTRARSAFEAARAILEDKVAQDSGDYRVHSALGITYAGLGRTEDAVSHGERAVDLYPISKDALEAPVLVIDLALVYTMVGDYDAALERLDQVLSIPSVLSAPWIEKDPRWDPLRGRPKFTALLEKHQIEPGY